MVSCECVACCACFASLFTFTAHADEVAEDSYGAGHIAVEENVALFEKLVDSTIEMADGLSHELFYCFRSHQVSCRLPGY